MPKYHNKKTEIDGVVFDSRAEALRYGQLRLLERVGEISDLTLQPKFELQPKFVRNKKTIRAIVYIADFQYVENGKVVIEDVKGGRGTQTQAFLIKSKMLMFRHPDLDFRVVAA